MDFQNWPLRPPVRIMLINPLIHTSKLVAIKLLSGAFGVTQLVDLILLVYSNEIPAANGFVQEILACNFGCLNKIEVTSDLPSITDADIFYCVTNFSNPNILDFDNLDTDDQFDSFYLYIKIALSLGKSYQKLKEEKDAEEKSDDSEKTYKPLFIGDGLIVLDILNTMGAEGMAHAYFCSGCIPALARIMLADHLKVRCKDINLPYVWGANQDNFHIEIEKPYIIHDKIKNQSHCDWEMVSRDILDPLKLDGMHFDASWMRKEFVQKLTDSYKKSVCGPLYQAWKMNRCLTKTYMPRIDGKPFNLSGGVISDGSLRTIKGIPYILPLVVHGDGTWEINTRFGDIPHVIQEIRRFNKIAKQNHDKLVKYLNKFLEHNIIRTEFVPTEENSSLSSISSTIDSAF